MTLPYGPLVANLQAAIAWLVSLLRMSPRLELISALSLSVLTIVGRALVLLWVGVCCMRLWRRPEPTELLFASASSLLMLAVFGAALFGTWYHVWWLPLGLLLGRGYLYRAAVCATVTSSLAYLM
ncbi:MAG: hypothetical protein ACI85K_000897 [Hyphomicrobiaceae bacterium]|jgi:hypothetical protein